MGYKSDFIRFLVESKVLLFGDFTTKSGRQSPYFINIGMFNSGSQLARLGEYYSACIRDNIEKGNLDSNIDALFGPAYKGIPLSATTSIALSKDNMDVGFSYNRKEAKDHGEKGTLVGYPIKENDNVVIIEDVITAGTAVREIMPLLKDELKANVTGLIVSVDRMEKSNGNTTAIQDLEQNMGIKTFPIVTIKDIIEELYNKPLDGVTYIDDEKMERINRYMEQYCV